MQSLDQRWASTLDQVAGFEAQQRDLAASGSQFERQIMLERQREGIAKAKREGKYKGRAPTARRQASAVMALRAEGVSPGDIARKLGLARSSVYRVSVVSAYETDRLTPPTRGQD